MARVKIKGAGGKSKSVDAIQAAQLGLNTLDDGVPAQTGQMDQPIGPGILGGAVEGMIGSKLSPTDRAVYEKAKPILKNAFGQIGAAINPMKQRSMFGAVASQTKQNPQTDIMNLDANRWKKMQRKAGLTEV